MTLLIGLVVLACAVWVLFDSHKKGARNPAGWAVFVAVIWIIALPYYLYKRNKLAPADKAPAPSNRWVGLVLVVVLVGATTFNAMRQEALPACASPEVTEVLGRLLSVANKIAVDQGSPEGFRVIINTGRIGQQEVPHLHAHIVGGDAPVGPMLKRIQGD